MHEARAFNLTLQQTDPPEWIRARKVPPHDYLPKFAALPGSVCWCGLAKYWCQYFANRRKERTTMKRLREALKAAKTELEFRG